jgi:hypothetical protein
VWSWECKALRTGEAKVLEGAQKRVDKQAEALKVPQDKVAESEHNGYGKRLEQRQHALAWVAKACKDAQDKQAKLREQASALGSPRERMDRDFRKQTTLILDSRVLCDE